MSSVGGPEPLHHNFLQVNRGKSSLMFFAPAATQIIAADILLPQNAPLSLVICFDLNHLFIDILTNVHHPAMGRGALLFSSTFFDLRTSCFHFELAARFGRMPKAAEVQFAQDCSYTITALKDSICPRYSSVGQKRPKHVVHFK